MIDTAGWQEQFGEIAWHYLAFLSYPEAVRRSLSTTNVVEAIDGQLEITRRNGDGYFTPTRP